MTEPRPTTNQAPDVLPEDLAAFVPMLAEALSLLDDAHHLGIEVDGTRRYMQFAAFDGNLRAETVGNTYLVGCDILDAGELAWLAAHGWNDPDEGGNHWRHWEPADFLAAATVTVVTLHQIHGVDDLRELLFGSEDPAVLDVLGSDE